MIRSFFFVAISFLLHQSLHSQIIKGSDTLYCNEWIHFGQPYFKIAVAEDGIYRIPLQTLSNAGLPVEQVQGGQFQLFHNGEEVPLYSTTEGILGSGDFLEFYGKKNSSELDRYLFEDPDKEMMNPLYSLITDTSAYFLTWSDTTGLRYQVIPNNLNNLPAKEEYYLGQSVQIYFNSFYKKINALEVKPSDFDMTEGWAGNFKNSQDIDINLVNVYAGGPAGQLYLRYGTGNGQHRQLISLNNEELLTDEFSDFQVRQHYFEVPNATLTAPMKLKLQGLVSASDRSRVANVILRYPAVFNFNNQASFSFQLPASAAVRYLEISNFKATGGLPVLYDLTHQTRMNASFEGGLVKIALPPSADTVQLVLINSSTAAKTVDTLKAVSFMDYSELNAEYVILSNPRLYLDGNGLNQVQEYANYRSSSAGGGYSTVIVDVQQLYDQFSWGLNRHPLSIRNFGHFIKKKWPAVKYFFVIGKGREYTSVRTPAQLANAANASYFVPTFGVPGADNLLLSTNSTAMPVIPLGRLAASTPEEISLFLKKVKDFEANAQAAQSIENRQWMKNILHLGGGGVAAEQALIKAHLAGMESIISNNLFGASVTSFFKSSSDPIQVSKSEQIFEYINKGVAIITFFGHSAIGTFDLNIDNPDNYDNFGKYPVIFSLGCYTGNIHTSGQSITERFVFQKDKAAIGMVATAGLGYISALNAVMSRFYTNLGGADYGKTIGVQLQNVIGYFEDGGTTQKELLQQMTYHGDPAIRLFASEGPDYLIDPASVRISPKHINVRQDSFSLQFSVINIGKGIQDTIAVEIEQELPDGNRFRAAQFRIKAPAYQTEVEVKLSTVGKAAIGRNRLFITADVEDEVQEHPLPTAEMNNELADASGQKGVFFFITDYGATPVYPQDFAIVGDGQVVLRASTSNALADKARYLIEIDTAALFNSPLKKSTLVEQTGGVIEWKPDFLFENEKVYYWRISPDSIDPNIGYTWESRSFTYISGSPDGWSQRHYWQFLKDRLEDMRLEEDSRRFKFPESFIDFRIRNKLYDASDPPNGFVNGVRWSDFFRWEIQESVTVVVFDTLGRIWFNWKPGEYGSVNTSAARIGAYPFRVETTADREKVIDFIEDIIPDNAWVIAYTTQRSPANDLNIAEWEADSLQLGGKNLFNLFEAQGAQYIRQLKDDLVPYCFVFRKNKGAILEQRAASAQDEINAEIAIPGTWYEGRVRSVDIGPASSWGLFQWEYDDENSIEQDTFFVDIFGYSKDRKAQYLLFEKIKETDLDLSAVSVDSFPYLRLEFFAKDSIERSPVQLKSWTLYYEGLPDAAFDPVRHFLFYKDTLPQGDMLHLESHVSATNNYPMDSLLVRYDIRDPAGKLIRTESRAGKLEGENGFDLSFSHPTRELAGAHQLVVQLNPDGDQEERHTFNNFLVKDFYVQQDVRNPLLDVTFDGMRIINGDLVSPNPQVLISLKDENPFLLLQDTSVFKLILQQPDGTLQNIPLHSPAISFQPASSGANNCSQLEWRPVFEKNGDYVLIIQAADASGNSAGDYDFKVSFKVILEKTISHVLPYPNPFSTATRFVYTLTGAPPTFFKIQIMTVSGRIVREITQDEIGPLRIGTHQTDFTWDGTDEFGNRLATGVYLYRVLARDAQNQDYEQYETGAEGFFKRGFGKLTIIR